MGYALPGDTPVDGAALPGGGSSFRGFLAFLVAAGCLVPLLLQGGGISAEELEDDDGEQAGGGGA
jgi:hypothetical protein